MIYLAETDPAVATLIQKEHQRQEITLNLIAAENTAPNDITPEEPVVTALRAAHLEILGKDPGVEAFVAGSDAPYMGFPTVICGPGSIAQAHTTCEFVDLQEVADAARLYLYAALRLLE